MLKRATSLDQFYESLNPKPLAADELGFYQTDVDKVRGSYNLRRLILGLERAVGKAFFKEFLMGHQGVGKSTELTRLAEEVKNTFQVIRLSATSDLDPSSFQPFDVLLLMMVEIVKRTADPIVEGGAGAVPPDSYLRPMLDWLATEKVTTKGQTDVGVQAAAGIGPTDGSLWGKALGLFGNIKGEAKYASSRTKEVVEYRVRHLPTLVTAVNALLVECNDRLRETTGKEWLFVWEDFDKPGIRPELIETFFLTYANVLNDLKAHVIFTIPIALGYAKTAQLKLPCHCIPDTPVFDIDHAPHAKGRDLLRKILVSRVEPALFDEGQMERLIVASGGNLRDLFTMTSRAADNALLDGASTIKSDHVNEAVRALRTEYERRLGQDAYDKSPIEYPAKVERLLRIYDGEVEAAIGDPVLTSLLRARAVLEFNGERWLGVHPLVVDILHRQGKIELKNGVLPGGTA